MLGSSSRLVCGLRCETVHAWHGTKHLSLSILRSIGVNTICKMMYGYQFTSQKQYALLCLTTDASPFHPHPLKTDLNPNNSAIFIPNLLFPSLRSTDQIWHCSLLRTKPAGTHLAEIQVVAGVNSSHVSKREQTRRMSGTYIQSFFCAWRRNCRQCS